LSPRPEPKIFVVDDSGPVRDSLAFLLSAMGWPVRAFATADDLLEAVSEERPACIVSDLDMPGMDGAELVESLRLQNIQIPVIVVTGLMANAPLALRATTAGAREILSKPFSENQIQDALDRALARVH
jgi:FixJ family two-component response regulator